MIVMSSHDQIRHDVALAVEVGADHQEDAGEVVQVLVDDADQVIAEDAVDDEVQVEAVVGKDVEEDVIDEEVQVVGEVGDAVVVGSRAIATRKAANLLVPLKNTPAVADAASVETWRITSRSPSFRISSETF